MRVQVAVGEPTESQPFSPPPAPLLSSHRRTGRVRPRPLPQLRRCSLKPPLRTKSVGTKVSEPEFAALETRARASGLTLSEWVRDVLLASSPGAGAEAANQVMLGELLALRTILINLLFSISQGRAGDAGADAGADRAGRQGQDAAGAGEAGRVPADSSIGSRDNGGDGTVSEWGRKEYTGWPSRAPVWTCAAVFVWLLIFAGGMVYRYTQQWSFAEREYMGNYMKASTLGWLWDESYYQLLTCVDKKGENHVVIGNEIESGKMANGETGYRVTEEGAQAGAVASGDRAQEVLKRVDAGDSGARCLSRSNGVGLREVSGVWVAALLWPVLLFFAVPKDRKRELEFQHGRRLRGPELLTTAEFNAKLGRRRWLRREPADGLGFINENRSWADGTFRNRMSCCVRIPRERESMHVLVMGDTGQGKSAIVRRALCQIEERGETAIVYDPAMEYLPQFYEPERGDVILNPLDERCPFWTPGDEVPHEAEALTLAASLFPEQGRENRFFVEAPRKIFAHLLNLKPTPEQLTGWLSNPEEIDRRVKGTEMAAMIDPHGGPQRSGVLGSLNMVADAFKLLPKEPETTRRWSTAAWAKERKGMDFYHIEADSAGAASPADQPMAGPACAAHDGRGIGCPAEDVVRTGRTGELAAVAAAHDGDHGEPQIELSDDPWVPGQSADRNAVRDHLRGAALAACDEDLPEDERAECGGVDLEGHRGGRDRALPGDAHAWAVPAGAQLGEPAAGHLARAAGHGVADPRARSVGRLPETWQLRRRAARSLLGASPTA